MFVCLKLQTSYNSVEIKPVRDVRPEQIRVVLKFCSSVLMSYKPPSYVLLSLLPQ